jgi:hypothetical protein
MTVLIPAIGSCTFATGGERRFAERLEAKLEDDYLCWYEVALGDSGQHPDFMVFHPRRGLLVLEVKDWRADTIAHADRQHFRIHTERGEVQVPNPLEQARSYAHTAVQLLQADAQLVHAQGKRLGQLVFPWGIGVVFPKLTRKQFWDGQLDKVLAPHRVICQDEMFDSVEAEAFQQRLWDMFSHTPAPHEVLSLPQIDRVRWHLFPEVRIPRRQADLFENAAPTMDLLQVMDLQQEQLARSLGEGHRVIHGVAGSGKTLILGYRAEHLAKVATKPILVLCFNKSLAGKLATTMQAKGLGEKVVVQNFHQWCRAQLVAYQVGLPADQANVAAFFEQMVQRVIQAVDRGQIPAAQYDAVLIDEGHDFAPEWFKLVAQMVNPRTNSLLVLYDDAQSIYGAARRRKFSFKSVGIQASGRTTILKVNYRNTDEILRFARDVAQSVLQSNDADDAADDDGVPLLLPQSAGRSGKAPEIIQLPNSKAQGVYIAQRLKAAHQAGMAWRDMAVVYRADDYDFKPVLWKLESYGVPTIQHGDAHYASGSDKVTLITMHSAKGLEFPMVVIPSAQKIRQAAQTDAQEAKLLYVAMTRATQELLLCELEPAATGV